jgi:hypothetical protein
MILLESLTNILEITCTRFRAGLFWFVQVLVVFVACPLLCSLVQVLVRSLCGRPARPVRTEPRPFLCCAVGFCSFSIRALGILVSSPQVQLEGIVRSLQCVLQPRRPGLGFASPRFSDRRWAAPPLKPLSVSLRSLCLLSQHRSVLVQYPCMPSSRAGAAIHVIEFWLLELSQSSNSVWFV